MTKTKHILEGIGLDGKEFCVYKDARGFFIKCGHQKQTTIRLPTEFSEAEINISTISERIDSYVSFTKNKTKNEDFKINLKEKKVVEKNQKLSSSKKVKVSQVTSARNACDNPTKFLLFVRTKLVPALRLIETIVLSAESAKRINVFAWRHKPICHLYSKSEMI